MIIAPVVRLYRISIFFWQTFSDTEKCLVSTVQNFVSRHEVAPSVERRGFADLLRPCIQAEKHMLQNGVNSTTEMTLCKLAI
jgi:hypothetical protein